MNEHGFVTIGSVEDSDAIGINTSLNASPSSERIAGGANIEAEYEGRIALFYHIEQFKNLTDDSKKMATTLKTKHIQIKEPINALQKDILEKKNEHTKADVDANAATRQYDSAKYNVGVAERARENAKKFFEEALKGLNDSESNVETAKQKLEDADKNVDAANKKFDETNRNVTEATQKLCEAKEKFRQSLGEYDLNIKQLRTALSSLQWHKEQEKKASYRLPLPPIQRDELGQTLLPSTVWDVPLREDITETIEIKSTPKDRQWAISGESGQWQIMFDGKVIVSIRRQYQKLQIEWTEEVKSDFNFSIMDTVLIVHTINHESVLKIATQKEYHLFNIDNTQQS